ncbi:MAG: helix-turn-helix transcriptional regulator, partial [Cyclobacteriaceae bacterium]
MEAVTAEAKMFVYARRQLGMSQRRLAIRLGVNQSSISKIESEVHRPRVSTIRKLERLMRLPAEH